MTALCAHNFQSNSVEHCSWYGVRVFSYSPHYVITEPLIASMDCSEELDLARASLSVDASSCCVAAIAPSRSGVLLEAATVNRVDMGFDTAEKSTMQQDECEGKMTGSKIDPTRFRRARMPSSLLTSAVSRAFAGGWPAVGSGILTVGLVVVGPAAASVFPAEFEVSSLATGDGSEGFVLNGVELAGHSAVSLSSAGDVNADGVGDLIIGEPFVGASYVVFGRNTSEVGNFPPTFELQTLEIGDGSAGFVLVGAGTNDSSGRSVSTAGDVNGDGVGDIIVGAAGASSSGSRVGASYVVFGRDTARVGNFPAQLELSNLATGDGSDGFVLNGVETSGESGRSVKAAGDVNGDGVGDLLIGA